MTNDRPSELLGQLPRTRPHRRSTKRPARAAGTAAPAEPRETAKSTGTAESTERHARATSPAKRAAGAKGRSQTAKRPSTKATASTNATASTKATASTNTTAATKATASKATKPAKRGADTAPARTEPARTERLSQPAQPRGVPAAGRTRRPSAAREASPQADATPILRTALQAAGEIAEIGLVLSGRALRRAIERLPRA